MESIFWIYTLLVLLSFQPLYVHSQIVLQCGDDPFKCPNPPQPATQPCCCFGILDAACDNRTDCAYDGTQGKCRVLFTEYPTIFPTYEPSEIPTRHPTINPTAHPTFNPTVDPTPQPTPHPTDLPTLTPIANITASPTLNPTSNPSINPTTAPSINPSQSTSSPSIHPSANPSYSPTQSTANPTQNPSSSPTFNPTQNPSQNPTFPTTNPSITPTISPNNDPTTLNPTIHPSVTPTIPPTFFPTMNPTASPAITSTPTSQPTVDPSANPTDAPTLVPTANPTFNPTIAPTQIPSVAPNYCTECEIYNLTLTDIASNLTIKDCPKPTVPNCKCNANGMSSLTLLYIGESTASRIDILYQYNIILCTYNHVEPNTEIVCDVQQSSDYRKFRQSTKYRIYYGSKSSEHYCVGKYDTSCDSYILGQVNRDCPYLSVHGWTDNDAQICFNDGTNVHLNYWQKKAAHSDSSNGAKNSEDSGDSDSYRYNHQRHQSQSSDSRRRTRRRQLSYDDKCIGNNQNIRYLWDTDADDGCDGHSNDKKRRRSLLWAKRMNSDSASYSASSSSEDGTDPPSKILVEVCLTYEIAVWKEDCGILQSVFMPLCTNNETDFDPNRVTAQEITDLIVSYTPQEALIPIGYRDSNGTLGILAQFMKSITAFELCLGNVTVDLKEPIVNYSGAMDIADRVTFSIDYLSSVCPSDGLPCLNFYFEEKCPTHVTSAKLERHCDCDGGGLLAIYLRYSANYDAEKIEVYSSRRRTNERRLLCTFYNVSNNDTVVCDESLQRNTYFKITYSNDYGVCQGVFRTDCAVNILGQNAAGCNALIVVGWMDKMEAICDESGGERMISRNNAFIHDRFNIVDAFEVLDQVNIYIKWTLIGMMIMFLVLMAIALVLCACGKRFGIGIRKVSKDETYVSNTDTPVPPVLEDMERNSDAKEEKSESHAITEDTDVHRRHKSINFDEEEVVMECYYDIEGEEEEEEEDDVLKELRTRSASQHTKHKSINLSEELILNRIWNECEEERETFDIDSNEAEQMLHGLHLDEYYLD